MKIRTASKVIAGALAIGAAGAVMAAGTTAVEVRATVAGVCRFSSGTMSAIELGTMDPSTVGATGVSKNGDITYNCTKGLTPAVTTKSGGTTLTHGSDVTKTIAYTFTLGTPEAGNGFSVSGNSKVVATAAVTQLAVQEAPAGTYKDTVTLEINN